MPTSVHVNELKINKLTKAQYDAAVLNHTIGDNELSIITDLSANIQVDTMPAASASFVDQIYEYVGTTDANYTNGYFYKCVNNSGTYTWERIDVQPHGDPLPSQTGNSGKFLTTNGTTPSWATVDALPSQTGQSGKFLTTDGTDASWGNALANETHYSGSSASIALTENTLASNKDSVGGVIIGYNAQGTSGQGYEIVIGNSAKASWMGNVTIGYAADGAGYDGSVTIGDSAKTDKKTGGSSLSRGTAVGGNANAKGNKSVALGYNAKIDGDGSIQIGEGNHTGDNSFYVTSYKLMDLSDGTIPESRLADTTSAITGQALVLDSTGNAVWATVDGLPSQSGQSGKYLTTNGTSASWATVDVLPSQTSQSGKFLTTNGTTASWDTPVVATLKVWGAGE